MFIEPMLIPLIISGIIGGLINLDTACVGQLMLSRPLVACPLTMVWCVIFGFGLEGLIMGLMMGLALELIWIRILPLGAHTPPNVAFSSVIAASLSLLTTILQEQKSDFILILLFSIFIGIIGGKLDVFVKKINLYLAHWVDRDVHAGKLEVLEKINRIGIIITFLLGSLFCVLANVFGLLLLHIGVYSIDQYEIDTFIFLPLLLFFGIGAGLETFTATKRHLVYFTVSFLITISILSIFRG